MRRLYWGLGVAAAAAVLAAPALAFDEVFQQTYPLRAGGSFQLRNVNGSVEVSGWERDAVEVRAVKSARRDPRDLQRVRIEVEAKSDWVAVHTRYPYDEGVEVYVEYRVRVPQRVFLSKIATVNGAVRVSGVEATGELRTVNGNIEVFDSAGRLSTHTTNGSVRLELRRLEAGGPMALETVNGSVVLALPADAAADLEVRTLNGDFRSELPITLEGSLSGRRFRGRLGSGGTPIRMRTMNGGIRVVAAKPMV